MDDHNDHKIILLQELFATRSRRQKELDYYNEKLADLQSEMEYIQRDIDVTNVIIELIQDDNVIDLQKYLETRARLGEGGEI
jgi:hypothetical protein